MKFNSIKSNSKHTKIKLSKVSYKEVFQSSKRKEKLDVLICMTTDFFLKTEIVLARKEKDEIFTGLQRKIKTERPHQPRILYLTKVTSRKERWRSRKVSSESICLPPTYPTIPTEEICSH